MRARKGLKYILGKRLLMACCLLAVSGFLSAQNWLVVSVAEANIYLAPDFESEVIDILTEGDILSLFESRQNHRKWLYVAYYSQTHRAQTKGFIHASQIEIVMDSVNSAQYASGQDVDEQDNLVFSNSRTGAEQEKEFNDDADNRRNHSVKIGAIYAMPSQQSFKDIYGSGIGFGGEFNFGLWKSVQIWISGHYYANDGSLPVTDEATTLSLVALGIGPKLRLSRARISPYLGVGPVIYFYKEENPIGLAEGTGLGFIGQLGVSIRAAAGLILDASVVYTYCQVQPQNIKANVGGFQVGLSFGYVF